MQRGYYSNFSTSLIRRYFSIGKKKFSFDGLKLCKFSTEASNSTASDNLYEILGVENTATAKDIKAAYYELSKKHHPDVGGGTQTDARRFVQIAEAYETLGNEEKRREYDEQRIRSSKIFDATDRDIDLETLKEFQRKWNLRRRHYEQESKARSNFERKHDEEFESFYRRYKENIAKARQWDETVGAAHRYEARREHYTDFQKEMIRKQHQKQMDQAAGAFLFIVVALMATIIFFILGKA